jgi:hypothetical protein
VVGILILDVDVDGGTREEDRPRGLAKLENAFALSLFPRRIRREQQDTSLMILLVGLLYLLEN